MADIHVTTWGTIPRGGYARELLTWVPANGLPPIVLGTDPFNQHTWPVPPGARRNIILRVFTSISSFLPDPPSNPILRPPSVSLMRPRAPSVSTGRPRVPSVTGRR